MRRLGAAALAGALLLALAGCSSEEPAAEPSTVTTTTAVAPSATTAPPDPSTLRGAAAGRGVRVGVALQSDRLDDPAVAELVATQFSSLTAENEMKWPSIETERDEMDFTGADRLVDAADAGGMEVRGHTLVWGQEVGNGMPEWLDGLSSAEVEDELGEWIDTSVGRYAGRVDRWDVVNEPIALSGGVVDDNVFSEALGPDWVAWALERAHSADPGAELWINEHSVEQQPEKAEALIALVEDLQAAGAPLDGVGLQTHAFSGQAPPPGTFAQLVERLRALGVAVAITEMDVPLVGGTTETTQADAYAQIVGECVAAGCEEITLWGLDDGHTWLDAFLGQERTDPLLFDRDLQPKPAFDAVHQALQR